MGRKQMYLTGRIIPAGVGGEDAHRPVREIALGISAQHEPLGDGACSVIQVDREGFLADSTNEFVVGERLLIALGDCGSRSGSVSWVGGTKFACRFDERVPAEIVDQFERQVQDTDLKGDIAPTMGDRLRNLRLKKSMNQTEFGRALGVSKVTIWNWETGKTRPREAALADVC